MKKQSSTLWLIRHGETAWNAVGRAQGHLDVPLNDAGRAQAARLADRLEREHRARPFTAAFSSDLGRAKDTAQETVTRLGLPLAIRPELRERNFGVLSSLTAPEMEAQHPALYAHWRARTPDFPFPGGETLVAFNARVLEVLRELAQAHPDGEVLVVTHGGVLDVVYRAAMGLALDATRHHALPNASLNRVRVHDGGTFEVELWGDVSHLDAAALDER